MKEVSLLLGALCRLLPVQPVPAPPGALLTEEQVGSVCMSPGEISGHSTDRDLSFITHIF